MTAFNFPIIQKKITKLLFTFLLLAPSLSLADAGTPLMWASAFHLLIGNALIGVLEGLLLAKFFKVRAKRAIGFMIPANYFSAWVGVLILGIVQSYLRLNLYNAWRFLWFMVGFTYLLTLILELPFIAFCLRKNTDWLSKSFKATILVNTISYVLLFGWYAMASQKSLYTNMHIVKLSEISLPKNVRIYYILPNGLVKSRFMTDTSEQTVYDLKSSFKFDRLTVESSSVDTNKWDLIAIVNTDYSHESKKIVIQKAFTEFAAPSWEDISLISPKYADTWINHGQAILLGSAETSSWRFWSGSWAGEGLIGENSYTNETINCAFETPFGEWYIRNATQLPDDDVLFQLGDDQICILDPNTKKVALVCYGRGPVAILK